MNVSILKRLAAIESKIQKPNEFPDLILIHFDQWRQQWRIQEIFPPGTGTRGKFQTKESLFERVQDYVFPAEGNPRVIMDTFASVFPEISPGLFCFDLAELRQDLEKGDSGALSIAAIKGTDENNVSCEIIAFTQ